MQLSNAHCRQAGAVAPARHGVRQLVNEQLMTFAQQVPHPLLSVFLPALARFELMQSKHACALGFAMHPA